MISAEQMSVARSGKPPFGATYKMIFGIGTNDSILSLLTLEEGKATDNYLV